MDTPELITITLPDNDEADSIIVSALQRPRQYVRVVHPHMLGPRRRSSDLSTPPAVNLWSPLGPFAQMRAEYRQVRRAVGRRGVRFILSLCIAASLAAVIWRHQAALIGVGAGLLVALLLIVRSGAYREYRAAIEETHGLPALSVVLRYNATYTLRKVRSLWWH